MYAIICNARKGASMGISTLALVDRAKSKSLWWTDHNSELAMKYRKRSAAEFAASRLKQNNARVVSSAFAHAILSRQFRAIVTAEREADDAKCMDAAEAGWDAHKTWV
ncbi:hypothetical protein [Tropicimonas sp. IMCC34011]|uniref:hypothetical protein n=1 Tax=Tropicimonas sp. IMCC34011 TaxID=2248759 RepID=UPI000E28906F|nr:hypothetical protein [Tropicimonas sp. IMCC34011]